MSLKSVWVMFREDTIFQIYPDKATVMVALRTSNKVQFFSLLTETPEQITGTLKLRTGSEWHITVKRYPIRYLETTNVDARTTAHPALR